MKRLFVNNKKNKIIFLFLYVAFASFFVYLFKPVYLLSIFIVLGPPSLVNFFWLKKSKTKIFIFSVVTTFLFAPPVEISARLADAWDVQSVLPRIFGIAPIENLLFAFFNFFWVLCFYEYFVDKDRSKKINSKIKIIVGLYCVLFLLVFFLFFYNQALITLNYHLLAVIILFIPGLILFYKNPKIIKKTWLPTFFFAIVFFIYEIVSLLVGSWWWPGEYLWPIKINGIIFPIDDVLIWYLLSTPVLIAGYEFFVDDNK